MDNSLILCGGTGAHVGVSLLRLHTLGHALGFFDLGGKPFDFPKIFLVDQDSGDGTESEPTAWQLANRLVAQHPGRFDWFATTGSPEAPELTKVTPLPIGPNQHWYKPPNNSLASRFESSPLLPVLASVRQRQIDYSKGMMGSPAIGSLLFKLKEYDERNREMNHDETFGQMLKRQGRIVVAGSGVGGTGASVGPTLAQRLAERGGNQVMAVMVLNWFEFDEEEADSEKREKAQLRNRIMRENANSALEFYGQSLARTVATVPVGIPSTSLTMRRYTADVGQPVFESYIHGVAALCGERHFLNDRPFSSGLYVMGAVERGRLAGDTAIPGGTLQELANQAATVLDLLQTYQTVLSMDQGGRVVPAIYEAVERIVKPELVAGELKREIIHYREQLDWMRSTLAIDGIPNRDFTREADSRRRLGQERRVLQVTADASPEQVALALFHWSAQWVREAASPTNGLRLQPGEVRGGHWPDLQNEAINVAVRKNGDLTRVPDSDIAAVLEAFVDRRHLSSNGWPHPLAAADYFRHAIERGERSAFRQLELLMVGLVSGAFELRPLRSASSESPLSLESLAAEYRRRGFEGLGEFAVVDPRRGALALGFNSPHTLLCPVPYMDDAGDHQLWQEIWVALSGANDGSSWTEVKSQGAWGNNDLVVRQIRSWIEHQRRSRPGGSPPWTQIFSWYPGVATSVPFGAGQLVKTYWGSANAPARPLIEISLPTREVGVWVPPSGTPELSESDLEALVPALLNLEQDGTRTFWRVEFEIPEHPAKVRGWWEDHLNLLLREGHIHIWSRTEANALIVGVMRDGVLHATRLANSQVLGRGTVTITSCTPFLQDPVPGSSRAAKDVRYPDIPIQADYLDLVTLVDGTRVTAALKEGRDVSAGQWRPTVGRDERGRFLMKWMVRFDGRIVPLPVEIRLEEEPVHHAHWMVWPRFRTRSGAGWKAYYVYEHCSDARLFCDIVWLQAQQDTQAARLRRRPAEGGRFGPYPLSFRSSGESPAHEGGLPLAFGVRNVFSGEEGGVYLVPLRILPESPISLGIAVDFGTSHSVAAFQISGEQPRQVEFAPELADPDSSLTLHLSENRAHLEASSAEGGILASGTWLPTYRLERGGRRDGGALVEGFLPSELLLPKMLEEVQADNIADWQPARDYTIPPFDIRRSDLADFLLTDFKWDTGSAYFRGRERELREHYLGMFLELVMADVVGRSLGGFPSQAVQLTFTYPLRSTEDQVEAFRGSVQHLVARSARSLGIPLALKNGIGLYDESRAARVTTHVPGEVCLVADLGGGTLDLFIAADNQGGELLAEVADSARLGGNLLLRQIAQKTEDYLPGTWQGDPREIETQLRAWMRAKGASALFGLEAGGRPIFEKMNVSGFEKAAEADRTRTLLDRYFRLIVEYLARNLVSYLVGQWFPKVDPRYHDTLKISIQLRGNGWRLRYQKENYVQATQAIRDEVRRKVEELWNEIPGNAYPAPTDDRYWEDASHYAVPDPKAAPVKNVVTKEAMDFATVKDLWYSHTLVNLEVLRGNGNRSKIDWFSQVPFPSGASTQVHLKDITPSLVLSSPFDDSLVEIQSLDAGLQGRVNHSLQTEGVVDRANGSYRAPVAPLVWEAIFESRNFWPEKGGR